MAQQTDIPNPIQVQKFLRGIDYPTDKSGLMQAARQNDADDKVLSTINRLADKHYNSPNDVSEEIGKLK